MEPMTKNIENMEHVRTNLCISSDALDTDFSGELCDVYPDGRSMIMNDGLLLVRFHKGFSEYNFLDPNQMYELDVDL